MNKPKPPLPPRPYRPQPVPKVLQKKAPIGPPSAAPKPAPTAPPVYRPQPVPRVLQTKPAPFRSNRTPIQVRSNALKPTRLGVDRNATVIQRTLADAKRYALSNPNIGHIKDRADVERLLRNERIPAEDRRELLKRYNNGLALEEQIRFDVPEAAIAPQTNDEVTEQNYFTFWSSGEFGDPKANADGHFRKHVLSRREFQGRYSNVVEYTRAARAFARRQDVIADGQRGGNWGMYSYDEHLQRGEMVVLNGENGRLTSYYELTGDMRQVAEYIQSKLHAASWMEVRERLRQNSSSAAASSAMPATPAAASPLPIPPPPGRWIPSAYPDTPPHAPPGGWPPTPPGSPRGIQ